MSTNDDKSSARISGVAIGVLIAGALISCMTLGSCTKEDEIITQCQSVHSFAGQRLLDNYRLVYKCEEIK